MASIAEIHPQNALKKSSHHISESESMASRSQTRPRKDDANSMPRSMAIHPEHTEVDPVAHDLMDFYSNRTARPATIDPLNAAEQGSYAVSATLTQTVVIGSRPCYDDHPHAASKPATDLRDYYNAPFSLSLKLYCVVKQRVVRKKIGRAMHSRDDHAARNRMLLRGANLSAWNQGPLRNTCVT